MARPRWVTAKAFLLDERNGLVHEFNLDPSCTVTFQDAFAAGAFVAVGAPVPVGRYFAQTVRGKGLGVTVVGHAPPEIDQIEFLRHLLGELQERFEDRVKDRLELARAEEARVEAERRRLAAEAAALQARVRGVGRLQEAIAAASARLAGAASVLTAREAAVAAREAAHQDMTPRLQEIEAREEDVRLRGEVIPRAQEALRAREEELATMSARLKEREDEVLAREQESEHFFEELAAKVAKNARWERDLAKKAEALKAREGQLGNEDAREKTLVKARR